MLDEKSKLLKENMEVDIQFYDDQAMSVQLPNTVDLIIETEKVNKKKIYDLCLKIKNKI